MAGRTVVLSFLALGGYLTLRAIQRRRARFWAPAMAPSRDRLTPPRRDGRPGDPVRESGPEAMRDPPRRWEAVDEQADESFPASDPPANY